MELYGKAKGLENFMKDFSIMNKRELPEVTLWEKYLVYATVLGVADKLEKTMKIKIETFNETDISSGDIIVMNHMLRHNFTTSLNNSITSAYTSSRSTLSQSSSGTGSGGGFSGGGSFSGGGGGGGGHGF